MESQTERAALKCILDDNELIHTTKLDYKHFKNVSEASIFRGMRRLADDSKPIDFAFLMQELYEEIEQVGVESVNALAHVEVEIENFKHYEKSIIEGWQLREIKKLQPSEVTNLKEAFEIKEKLDKLSSFDEEEEYNHKESLLELHNDIMEQPKGLSGYDTGFEDLNYYLDGLQPEDLIVLAARPSVGKTAFALNLALNHGYNNKRVIVFSLEMPAKQIQKRMLSSIGNINGNKMKNPNNFFNADDWDSLNKSFGVYSEFKLHIFDKSGQTISDIRSRVKEIREKHPDDELLVVIDYLQLIRSDRAFERKDIEVGEISRSLKELARDEHLPVVVLSQLSRGVEQRQDKRPMLSDIRDSGAVEQDADVVMFLYRDDYYEEDPEKENIIEVIISKNRNGELGTVELYFKKEFSKFLGVDRRYESI